MYQHWTGSVYADWIAHGICICLKRWKTLQFNSFPRVFKSSYLHWHCKEIEGVNTTYRSFSSDLQDYQHAGALVCGWSLLSGLSAACVQDPRLPLVSQPPTCQQNKTPVPSLIRIRHSRKTMKNLFLIENCQFSSNRSLTTDVQESIQLKN